MKQIKLAVLSIATLSSLPIVACYPSEKELGPDEKGKNIIHHAVIKDKKIPGAVKFVLSNLRTQDKQKYINATDITNTTPMFYALYFDNNSALEELLAHGANPNLTQTMQNIVFTAFHYCVFKNNLKGTKLFLKYGADINQRSTQGYTPLTIAIKEQYNMLAKCLLDAGANPNPIGNSIPPLTAALVHNSHFAFTLLKYGAIPNNEEKKSLQSICKALMHLTLHERNAKMFEAVLYTIIKFDLMSCDEFLGYGLNIFTLNNVLGKTHVKKQ